MYVHYTTFRTSKVPDLQAWYKMFSFCLDQWPCKMVGFAQTSGVSTSACNTIWRVCIPNLQSFHSTFISMLLIFHHREQVIIFCLSSSKQWTMSEKLNPFHPAILLLDMPPTSHRHITSRFIFKYKYFCFTAIIRVHYF